MKNSLKFTVTDRSEISQEDGLFYHYALQMKDRVKDPVIKECIEKILERGKEWK